MPSVLVDGTGKSSVEEVATCKEEEIVLVQVLESVFSAPRATEIMK